MPKPLIKYDEMKVIYGFQTEMIKSLITQILSSSELNLPVNKISPRRKSIYLKDIDKISERVIEKEIKYYEKKYKIKTPLGFAKLMEKLSKKEITQIRKKICQEVIKKPNS